MDERPGRGRRRTSARPAVLLTLLVVTVWLLVGPWVLEYPLTSSAQQAALCETGAAIVVGLAALRQRHRGPSRFCTAVVVVTGVLLAVSAAGQSLSRVWWNEGLTAVLLLVCGGALAVLPATKKRTALDRTEADA